MCSNTLLKKIAVICILGLSVFTGPVLAQGSWIKVNGPYGCYVADIAIDPTDSNIVYLASDGGKGIYKSTDAGQSWFAICEGLTDFYGWTVKLKPGDPQTIYLGTWGSFYKSTDAGESWSELTYDTSKLCALPIAIDPENPDIIYIGGWVSGIGDNLFKSTDGGITWTVKGQGLINSCIWSLAVDPINTSTVYAGTWLSSENYIYKSEDGGETWRVICTSPGGINYILVDPNSSQTIYAGTDNGVLKSIDGGMTWLANDAGITNPYVRHLAMDPHDSDVLYAATWGGVFKSTDAGISWDCVSDSFSTQFAKVVTPDPAVSEDNQIVYTGVFGGIYKTLSADVITSSWEYLSNGLEQDVAICDGSIMIHPEDRRNMYAGSFGGGLYRSFDGGNTWEPCNAGLPIAYMNGGGSLNSISPNIMYISTDGAGICRSLDGGDSWEVCNTGITTQFTYGITCDPLDSNLVYAMTSNGPFKSKNLGDIWVPINQGLEDQKTKELVIDPTNTNILYVAAEGLFKSTDGGTTWLDISDGVKPEHMLIRCLEMDQQDPATLYAGTNGGAVYKTTDAGISWVEADSGITASRVRDIVVDPTQPTLVYAATTNGIFRSTDGGNLWEAWNDGLTATDVKDLYVYPQNPSIIYAGTGSGLFTRISALPGVDENIASGALSILNNSSNPSCGPTSIRYTIPRQGLVSMTVYDASGQLVKTLINEPMQPGYYNITWNGCDEHGATASAGVYFLRLTSGNDASTLKVILTK